MHQAGQTPSMPRMTKIGDMEHFVTFMLLLTPPGYFMLTTISLFSSNQTTCPLLDFKRIGADIDHHGLRINDHVHPRHNMSMVQTLPSTTRSLTHCNLRTYLGFTRLQKALSQYRSTNPESPVTFTLKLAPYQLYPDFSPEGVSKYDWYKKERYADSAERMQMYIDYMTALGKDENLNFDLKNGQIANTLHAHRILYWIQEEHSPDAALLALSSLYDSYFCNAAHPSSHPTLLKACQAAGLQEEEAKELIENEEMGLRETKMAIREQVGNAVDSVPNVVFEGRKRDFTEIGAKGVGEYWKVLGSVEREAS
jgi:predicted DsbA family dithiol-disulfide isomerase